MILSRLYVDGELFVIVWIDCFLFHFSFYFSNFFLSVSRLEYTKEVIR